MLALLQQHPALVLYLHLLCENNMKKQGIALYYIDFCNPYFIKGLFIYDVMHQGGERGFGKK